MTFARQSLTLVALAIASSFALGAPPTTTAASVAEEHASHHSAASTSKSSPKPGTADVAVQSQMKTMQAMHEKMMAAKSPEERQALMADHMKAMQDGMAMMKGMGNMGSMGSMGADMPMGGASMPMGGAGMSMTGSGARMGGTRGASKHSLSSIQRMDMMQMMMEMMMDRLPVEPGTPPASK